MQSSTFHYLPERGWSLPDFPALDSESTLVLVFAAPEFMNDPAPFEALRCAYPRSRMIGCSAGGEIVGPCVNDGSISVAVTRFDHSRVAVFSTHISEADSRAAGERLARQFDAEGLRALFVLSDGLNVNGSELVRGLNAVLDPSVIITGGLAADGERFQGTWVLHDDKRKTNGIVAAGFYGERLRVGHSTCGGWDTFGPERRITRARDNVLYELDGQPALALYKRYLGDRAADLPATGLLFPLAIRKNARRGEAIMRCITAVDDADQSITFAGDIPTNYFAQLALANPDNMVKGSGEVARRARLDDVEGAALALTVSCVGRRMVLGERTEEETQIAFDRLLPGTKQVGFYSYGEIAPHDGGACDFHNQTLALTTIAEI